MYISARSISYIEVPKHVIYVQVNIHPLLGTHPGLIHEVAQMGRSRKSRQELDSGGNTIDKVGGNKRCVFNACDMLVVCCTYIYICTYVSLQLTRTKKG